MSMENLQDDDDDDEVESTHTGPGSRPGSTNSIRSVTIKSRRSSARSRRSKSALSGVISEHGDDLDEHGQGDAASEGVRSASRGAASSHHESWHDGSDAELAIDDDDEELELDPSRPNSSRPVSSRRSRRSSARRSASIKDRSRSHISGAASAHGEGEEGKIYVLSVIL